MASTAQPPPDTEPAGVSRLDLLVGIAITGMTVEKIGDRQNHIDLLDGLADALIAELQTPAGQAALRADFARRLDDLRRTS